MKPIKYFGALDVLVRKLKNKERFAVGTCGGPWRHLFD